MRLTKTVDAVARAVEHRAEAGFPAAMDHRRDVGSSTGALDGTAQAIGVVSLVGQHDGVLAQMAERRAAAVQSSDWPAATLRPSWARRLSSSAAVVPSICGAEARAAATE